ncbi:MAG: hypothetical protein ACRDT0_10900 [Pseudonocardiaceae bacterium]
MSTARGLPVTRQTLQEIGIELIHGGRDAFTRTMLDQTGWRSGMPLVLEGLRHVQAAASLRLTVAPLPVEVIYLDVPALIGVTRARQRDHTTSEDVPREDIHPVEQDLSTVRRIADLTLLRRVSRGAGGDGWGRFVAGQRPFVPVRVSPRAWQCRVRTKRRNSKGAWDQPVVPLVFDHVNWPVDLGTWLSVSVTLLSPVRAPPPTITSAIEPDPHQAALRLASEIVHSRRLWREVHWFENPRSHGSKSFVAVLTAA